MAKTKTVWKVVQILGGERCSAIIHPQEGGIRYNEPGQPTLAPGGTRLLAFKTKKAAVSFGAGSSTREVWKSEAKDVREQRTLYPHLNALRSRFIRFWKNGETTSYMFAPTGTVSCSELTLVKMVG